MSFKFMTEHPTDDDYDYDELLDIYNNIGLVFGEKKDMILLYDKEDVTILISNSKTQRVFLVNCRNITIGFYKTTLVDVALFNCRKVVVYAHSTKYRITSVLTQKFLSSLIIGDSDLYIMHDCHTDIDLNESCTRVIFGTHGNIYPGKEWLGTEEPQVDYSQKSMISYLSNREMRYDEIITGILTENRHLVLMYVSDNDATQEFCEQPILFAEPKCLCNDNDNQIVFYQMNFPQSVTLVRSDKWETRYSYTTNLPPLENTHRSNSIVQTSPKKLIP